MVIFIIIIIRGLSIKTIRWKGQFEKIRLKRFKLNYTVAFKLDNGNNIIFPTLFTRIISPQNTTVYNKRSNSSLINAQY